MQDIGATGGVAPSVPWPGGALKAAPTRPLDADVTCLHDLRSRNLRATGQRHIKPNQLLRITQPLNFLTQTIRFRPVPPIVTETLGGNHSLPGC
jgi:hypothetical protein